MKGFNTVLNVLRLLSVALGHVDEEKHEQVIKIFQSYPSPFSDGPSWTRLVEHDLEVVDLHHLS